MRVIVFRRFYLLALLLLVWAGPVKAAQLLTVADTQKPLISAPVLMFEDRTNSGSPTQAAVQFQRFQSANELTAQNHLLFGNDASQFWLSLKPHNKSHYTQWRFSLPASRGFAMSPIKNLTLFAADGTQMAAWPETNGASTSPPSVLFTLPTDQQQALYMFVENWPGVKASVAPTLTTSWQDGELNTELQQHLGFLWLIAGALFGAALVQMILTRQVLQGLLAVNAFLLGVGATVLQRPDFIPGFTQFHPAVMPLMVAAALGFGATVLQWAVSQGTGKCSALCSLGFLANGAVIIGTVPALPYILSHDISLSSIPFFLLTGTGLLLLVVNIISGFTIPALLWFAPSWALLTLLPWLAERFPTTGFSLYALLLGAGGVASVFMYWQQRSDETAALQKRLRQDLKGVKDKYAHETQSWEQKMESQRLILNDLKQREQQRSAELEQARQVAEEANKAKSDFLAIISHEIRTPMNGIMGIVQLLEQSSMDEKQREYIDVVKNSGETMVTLLNDILDYSKIEKGMIDLESISFSPRKLVQSVITLMSGRAEDKGISLGFDISSDIPEFLQGDPNRIRQILLNLVGNAVKFTEQGTVKVHVTAQQPPGQQLLYRFEIIDSGIGISPEAQTKLFQAYAQADASISRRFGGTGLGLTICRMLVQAMQGDIGLNSVVGQGSTFWFTLPLTKTDAPAVVSNAALQNTPVHYTPLNVLVIDDNAVNLKVVSGLLELDSHTVTTCMSGAEGLKLLDEHDFDIVLVDLQMPNMDGKSFARHVRQNSDKHISNLPLYALTGMAADEDKQAALEAGLNGTITKPVTQASLRAVLSAIPAQQEGHDDMLKDILSKWNILDDKKREKLMHVLAEGTQGVKDIYKILREEVRTGMASDNIPEEEMGNTIRKAPPAATSTEDAPAPGPLDLAMLGDLKNSLPAETLDGLLQDLINKSWEILAAMEDSLKHGDMIDVTEQAHNMKGMAGNFGLKMLMNATGRIEQLGRAQDYDRMRQLVPKIRPIVQRSIEALVAWRNENP